jgi:long-chain acyl-CoA synthetase
MVSSRSLVDYLLLHARNRTKHAALLEIDTSKGESTPSWMTWSDVAIRTSALATWLIDQRLGPEAIVASILPNSSDWIVLDLACQTLGIIHAPIDSRHPPALIEKLLEIIQPSLVVRSSARDIKAQGTSRWPAWLLDWNEMIRSEPKSQTDHDELSNFADIYERYQGRRCNQNTATILCTSGTTETPKGVMLSHHNLISNALGKLHAMPQSAADRRLNFLPFSHSYARTCELSTWLITGSELMIAPSLHSVPRAAQRYAPTLINGVPSFFDSLRRTLTEDKTKVSLLKYLGGSIRQLASGGAALNYDTAVFFEASELPILVGYGLTEASPVVCSNASSDGRTNNVGLPIPGVKLQIDSQGELWVSGPGVMQGYIHNASATATTIVNGMLRTGDLAEIDSSGRLHLVGRVRDTLVLSSGVKVAPYQVEKELKANAGIEDAVVLGEGWERCAAILVVGDTVWNLLQSSPPTLQHELIDGLQKRLVELPKYATPIAWIIRKNPFSANPLLVNPKGAPQRERIRIHYEPWLRESVRSGVCAIALDAST